MENKAFLIQSPGNWFYFIGIGVPVELKGSSHRPVKFASAIAAEEKAAEIGFSEYVNRSSEGPLMITVYTSSEFFGSTVKREGKMMYMGSEKYAQYENVPYVALIPKRKRNGVLYAGRGFHPYMLILLGAGHPDPDNMFKEAQVDQVTGVSISESKYMSFDERYQTDFDSIIDKYIAEKKVEVLMDFRYTKGANSYERQFKAA